MQNTIHKKICGLMHTSSRSRHTLHHDLSIIIPSHHKLLRLDKNIKDGSVIHSIITKCNYHYHYFCLSSYNQQFRLWTSFQHAFSYTSHSASKVPPLISDIHVTSTHYKVNNNFLSTFSALLRSWRNPHDCDSYQVLVVSWGVLGRLREILGLPVGTAKVFRGKPG